MVRCVVFTLTYNERENLPILVEKILAQKLPDCRLVVVDDSSPDGTGDLADAFARKHPGKISVHHRPRKEGYGAAYLDALRTIRRTFDPDCYVSIDADFAHDPDDLPKLLAALKADADVVIGSRYVPGGENQMPRGRRIVSAFANGLARTIAGNYRVRDNTTGYRGFTREVVESLPWDRLEGQSGYAFLTTFLTVVYRRGFRIVEVPVVCRFRERGASKLGFRHVIGFLTNALRLRWWILWGRLK